MFSLPVRYVVPMFQRPYVWEEKGQWGPLWDDIRHLAEQLLEDPAVTAGGFAAAPLAPHFLGAVVLDHQTGPVGVIEVRHVIDGQQRLTTLQLLLDAAAWATRNHGKPYDASSLDVLVRNPEALVQHVHETYKVWPTTSDRAGFTAAMNDDMVVPPALTSSRPAQAHEYFVRAITEWADVTGDPDKVAARLHALTLTLTQHLKLVVINLEHGDNAQVIFETLNARGTPLLAADLVKNFVFRRAEALGLNVEQLHNEYWLPFEEPYWRRPVAQGRQYRPAIDIFLTYWLTMQMRRSIPNDQVFVFFQRLVHSDDRPLEALLQELAADAQLWRSIDAMSSHDVVGTFRYRVLDVMDTGAVTPLLLLLLRTPDAVMAPSQRARALQALESWLVRRAVLRATSKDLNTLVLELIALVANRPDIAGSIVVHHLLEGTAESRYWPDDEALRRTLAEGPLYKGMVRARLRMVLEAVEDALRARAGALVEEIHCPRASLTIEHVLPQGWREHWGSEVVGDPDREAEREDHVHRLGNLTLVTGSLNPALSNRPWTDAQAAARGLPPKGKRSLLEQNSVLYLNKPIVAEHLDGWSEQDIDARGEELTKIVLALWPHGGELVGEDPVELG